MKKKPTSKRPSAMAELWWNKNSMLGCQRDTRPCDPKLRRLMGVTAFREGVKAERSRKRREDIERWQTEQREAALAKPHQ